MNKLMMTTLITVAIIPSMIFAKNGADDHLEGGHRSSGHTGATWTGVTHSGHIMPPKMGSGMMMNNELQGLHMAMGKLSSADKATLVTMIKNYLISKGIALPATTPDIRKEIKELRKDTREEIKMKRDIMKAKIQAMKGNGKATFKEFTITK